VIFVWLATKLCYGVWSCNAAVFSASKARPKSDRIRIGPHLQPCGQRDRLLLAVLQAAVQQGYVGLQPRYLLRLILDLIDVAWGVVVVVRLWCESMIELVPHSLTATTQADFERTKLPLQATNERSHASNRTPPHPTPTPAGPPHPIPIPSTPRSNATHRGTQILDRDISCLQCGD